MASCGCHLHATVTQNNSSEAKFRACGNRAYDCSRMRAIFSSSFASFAWVSLPATRSALNPFRKGARRKLMFRTYLRILNLIVGICLTLAVSGSIRAQKAGYIYVANGVDNSVDV